MSIRAIYIFCVSGITIILLTACGAWMAIPSPTPTILPTMTAAPSATPTIIPPTLSPPILEIPLIEPGTLAYDFIAHVCEAKWTNNGQDIPCPGSLDNIDTGSIIPLDNPTIEGLLLVKSPALLTIPAQNMRYRGIFGRYPAFTIQANDHFRAILACKENAFCELGFALEYYDAKGAYQALAAWNHRYGGGPISADVNLTPLAGQTIEFTLVVRDNGDPTNDFALWIAPYIYRP